jgi:hypothetical protein
MASFLLSSPLFSAQDGHKNQSKISLEPSGSTQTDYPLMSKKKNARRSEKRLNSSFPPDTLLSSLFSLA